MNAPLIHKPLNHTNAARLLISVTSVEEAKLALDHGADILDLKDPCAGALGALPMATIQTIVAYARYYQANHPVISATIGDLPMQPALIVEEVEKLIATEIDILKIGFFNCNDYQPCLDALRPIAQAGQKLIAVLFAEHDYPKYLISAIKKAGFYGVMLDTSIKNAKTLFDYYSEIQSKAFAEEVLSQALKLGMAGSLKLQHIGAIKKLNPSYIGFRGGVCSEFQRARALDADKIKAIRKVM